MDEICDAVLEGEVAHGWISPLKYGAFESFKPSVATVLIPGECICALVEPGLDDYGSPCRLDSAKHLF